ncbi:winged helix DNA-binding domain-containing protein [Pseudonocardia sp. CA-107938]|uniref:winged helix DNA-binding domain-containing protein n=1 Tax=Pseudonocardia sp. CA-107938 TaxID=3240021 RepID=UPI003D9255AD
MTAPTIDDAQRRARLATRHRLVPAERTADPVAITESLVALHSSDPVTVHLSAAVRMPEPALGPVETALYEDRTLVRHHSMRRTLWVFGRETANVAHHAATLDVLRQQQKLLAKALVGAGIADPDAWFEKAAADVLAVLADGPLTAREIGQLLPGLAELRLDIGRGPLAVPQPGHTRVLLVLGFAARVLRARPTGTWINGQYRWAAADGWLPGGLGEPLDPRTAAAELARRYLAAFGPVTTADVAWWMKWTVATTKRALADVGAVEVRLDSSEPGWVLPDDVDPVPDPGPSAVLLPGLDPSTMGWKQRGFHLDAALVPDLFDRNGNGGPAIWVDGRIVGGWVQRKDGTIRTELLTDVGAEHRAEIDRAAHTMEALLGDVRFTVRFPAPMQKRLLA